MAIRPKDLVIDIQKMTLGQYLLVETSPNFPFVNGVKSTVQQGEKATVVMPNLAYERLIVKVPQIVSSMGEIPAGGVPVIFNNLIVTPYINNGILGLSAKADSLTFATAPVSAKNERG